MRRDRLPLLDTLQNGKTLRARFLARPAGTNDRRLTRLNVGNMFPWCLTGRGTEAGSSGRESVAVLEVHMTRGRPVVL
jgi:hypothetical protein